LFFSDHDQQNTAPTVLSGRPKKNINSISSLQSVLEDDNASSSEHPVKRGMKNKRASLSVLRPSGTPNQIKKKRKKEQRRRKSMFSKRVSFGVVDVRMFQKESNAHQAVDLGTIKLNDHAESTSDAPAATPESSDQVATCQPSNEVSENSDVNVSISSELNKSVDMEFTQDIGHILAETKAIEDQEQSSVSVSVEDEPKEAAQEDEAETPLNPYEFDSSSRYSMDSNLEVSMEMTRDVGAILTGADSVAPSPAPIPMSKRRVSFNPQFCDADESMDEMDQPTGEELANESMAASEVSMEMTRDVGQILSAFPQGGNGSRRGSLSVGEFFASADTHTAEMEETANIGQILNASAAENSLPPERAAVEATCEMEFTQDVGQILSATTDDGAGSDQSHIRNAADHTNDFEISMELTGNVGQILGASMPSTPGSVNSSRASIGANTQNIQDAFQQILSGECGERTIDLPCRDKLVGADLELADMYEHVIDGGATADIERLHRNLQAMQREREAKAEEEADKEISFAPQEDDVVVHHSVSAAIPSESSMAIAMAKILANTNMDLTDNSISASMLQDIEDADIYEDNFEPQQQTEPVAEPEHEPEPIVELEPEAEPEPEVDPNDPRLQQLFGWLNAFELQLNSVEQHQAALENPATIALQDAVVEQSEAIREFEADVVTLDEKLRSMESEMQELEEQENDLHQRESNAIEQSSTLKQQTTTLLATREKFIVSRLVAGFQTTCASENEFGACFEDTVCASVSFSDQSDSDVDAKHNSPFDITFSLTKTNPSYSSLFEQIIVPFTTARCQSAASGIKKSERVAILRAMMPIIRSSTVSFNKMTTELDELFAAYNVRTSCDCDSSRIVVHVPITNSMIEQQVVLRFDVPPSYPFNNAQATVYRTFGGVDSEKLQELLQTPENESQVHGSMTRISERVRELLQM
jgi:MELT motif